MLNAYYRPARGGVKQISVRSIPRALRDRRGLLWVDVERPDDHAARLWEHTFRFHLLAIEDCLSESVQHPKVDDYDRYLFIIVHAVRAELPLEAEDTEELGIFLGPNYVVTSHHQPLPCIRRVGERVPQDVRLLSRGSDFLLYEILDHLIDDYLPILDNLDQVLDGIEAEIFGAPTRETLNRIFSAKRDTLYLRRVMGPQRDVLNRLSRQEFVLIRPHAAIYFRDVYDRLARITDTNDALRDLVSGALETYLSVVSNRLNEVMKFLTVVSTIVLPLSLIAGIYGMNFRFMPELGFRYGYFAALTLMAVLGLGMAIYFKRRGWW